MLGLHATSAYSILNLNLVSPYYRQIVAYPLGFCFTCRNYNTWWGRQLTVNTDRCIETPRHHEVPAMA